jgi:hypothetical protein
MGGASEAVLFSTTVSSPSVEAVGEVPTTPVECYPACPPPPFPPSRWLHHKAANFAPNELARGLAALAALRYRNPWLLRHWSRILATPKLTNIPQLSGADLATVVTALAELRWNCSWLLDALGDETAVRLRQLGENDASQATAMPRTRLSPSHAAKIASSLVSLCHRHTELMEAACAAALNGGGGGSSSEWSAADRAVLAWAATSVLGKAPDGLLRVAVADAAAAAGGLQPLALVRLAWACAAAAGASSLGGSSISASCSSSSSSGDGGDGSGGSWDGSGDGGGAGSSSDEASTLLCALVPALQQQLAPLLTGSAGSFGRLQELGPELLHVAQSVFQHCGVALLPHKIGAQLADEAGRHAAAWRAMTGSASVTPTL